MGGERGRMTKEPAEVPPKEARRFEVDEYYREYYNLCGMDWEVIKETRRRDFRARILENRVAALVFLAIGVALAMFAWSSQDFSFRDFGPFEWIVGLGGWLSGLGAVYILGITRVGARQ